MIDEQFYRLYSMIECFLPRGGQTLEDFFNRCPYREYNPRGLEFNSLHVPNCNGIFRFEIGHVLAPLF